MLQLTCSNPLCSKCYRLWRSRWARRPGGPGSDSSAGSRSAMRDRPPLGTNARRSPFRSRRNRGHPRWYRRHRRHRRPRRPRRRRRRCLRSRRSAGRSPRRLHPPAGVWCYRSRLPSASRFTRAATTHAVASCKWLVIASLRRCCRDEARFRGCEGSCGRLCKFCENDGSRVSPSEARARAREHGSYAHLYCTL